MDGIPGSLGWGGVSSDGERRLCYSIFMVAGVPHSKKPAVEVQCSGLTMN